MRKEKISIRILSLLLVALTIMGIFPSAIMTANADYIPPGTASLVTGKLNAANDDGTLKEPPTPPDEIVLADYKQTASGHYNVKSMKSDGSSTSISHFTVDFNVDGIKTKGYCTEYGKGIGSGYIGKSWVKNQKVDASVYSEEIIRFLDYYAYLQALHSEVHEIYFPEAGPCDAVGEIDKKIINGEYDSPYTERFKVEKAWTQANLNEIANQAQAFIWAAQEIGPAYKPFSDSYYRTQACTDRVNLCQSFGVSITSAQANTWFEQIYSAIMCPNSESIIPHFDHYIYHYGDGVQNMLVSLIPTPMIRLSCGKLTPSRTNQLAPVHISLRMRMVH